MVSEMSRRRASGALASLGFAACASPGGDDPHIERLLRQARSAHDLPGLAAAVVRGTSVDAIGVDGVRQIGTTEQIELTDRFHIASCTKSMTATLAAIAVHQGHLEWSTTLADCLPDLAAPMRAEYRSATLEQLLAHMARMPSYTEPGAERVAWMHALTGTPVEQRLALLRDVLASEEPSSGVGDQSYSNVGYVAACAMLERRTGTLWEDQIRTQLAAPLQLRGVGFGYPASLASPHQPRGHAVVDGHAEVLAFDPARALATCLYPAGAVHMSIGDLAIYARDHLNGLRGRRALLPPEYYARLHAQPPGSTSVFTLGWGVREDDRLGRVHFGAGSGGWFFARILIAPERDAAAVVASNSGDAAAATREVLQGLMEERAA